MLYCGILVVVKILNRIIFFQFYVVRRTIKSAQEKYFPNSILAIQRAFLPSAAQKFDAA